MFKFILLVIFFLVSPFSHGADCATSASKASPALRKKINSMKPIGGWKLDLNGAPLGTINISSGSSFGASGKVFGKNISMSNVKVCLEGGQLLVKSKDDKGKDQVLKVKTKGNKFVINFKGLDVGATSKGRRSGIGAAPVVASPTPPTPSRPAVTTPYESSAPTETVNRPVQRPQPSQTAATGTVPPKPEMKPHRNASNTKKCDLSKSIYINCGSINVKTVLSLRGGPSTSNKKMCKSGLKKSDEIGVRQTVRKSDGLWHKVAILSGNCAGHEGWVKHKGKDYDFVKLEKENSSSLALTQFGNLSPLENCIKWSEEMQGHCGKVTTKKTGLNLRRFTNTRSDKQCDGGIDRGAYLGVLRAAKSQSGYWMEVKVLSGNCKGKSGYVKYKYLDYNLVTIVKGTTLNANFSAEEIRRKNLTSQ